MNELKSLEFKKNIFDLIGSSELPISLAYYVMKEVTDLLKEEYHEAAIRQQSQMNNESEANEEDDN